MKMDLRTPQQKLQEKLEEIERKLDKVLEKLEAKEVVEAKSKKVDK